MKSTFLILLIFMSILSVNAQQVFTETDSYYQKGEEYKVIENDGIVLIANLNQVKQYGKYYQISLIIENATDTRFEFDPSLITGKYITNKREKKEKCAVVFSYEDYVRKARKRINTASALAGIGIGLQSFSTAPTSTVTYSDNTGYRSNLNVYNQYEKSRQIQDLTDRASEAEYQSREFVESMKDNYLLRETMFPKTSLAGYIFLKYEKCDVVDVVISLAGNDYKLSWTFEKEDEEPEKDGIDDIYRFE